MREADFLTFFKCSWLPSRLIDHEFKMQQGLNHLAGMPTPFCLASVPSAALSNGFKSHTFERVGESSALDSSPTRRPSLEL